MRYNADAPIKLNGIFCNESYGQAMIACEAGNDYSVELKKNTLTINDATSSLTTIEDNLSNFAAPIYVFCECNNKQNTTLEARRHQPMRLYSMEIVEIDPETSAETAKRNFIPCLNDHGKFGLWDSVEGVFYGNRASGADFVGAGKVIVCGEVKHGAISPDWQLAFCQGVFRLGADSDCWAEEPNRHRRRGEVCCC